MPAMALRRLSYRKRAPRQVGIKAETSHEQRLNDALFGRVLTARHLTWLTVEQKEKLAEATREHSYNMVRDTVRNLINSGHKPGEPEFDRALQRVLDSKKPKK
jgi:hypothetical protein